MEEEKEVVTYLNRREGRRHIDSPGMKGIGVGRGKGLFAMRETMKERGGKRTSAQPFWQGSLHEAGNYEEEDEMTKVFEEKLTTKESCCTTSKKKERCPLRGVRGKGDARRLEIYVSATKEKKVCRGGKENCVSTECKLLKTSQGGAFYWP